MYEELTFIGEWWVPSNNEDRAYGKLTITADERVQLQLDHRLAIATYHIGNMISPTIPPKYSVIHGITHEGNPQHITLCDCSYSDDLHLTAVYAFVGAWFSSIDELRFNKVAAGFSHLSDWIYGLTGLSVDIPEPTTNGKLVHRVLYARPDAIAATTKNGVKIGFAFRFHRDYHISDRQVMLKESVEFRCESKEALSYDEWLSKYLYPIHMLLNLGMDLPNDLITVTVFSENRTGPVSNHKKEIAVRLYYGRPRHHQSALKHHLHPLESLFLYSDVQDELEKVINRWLNLLPDLETVASLYFGVQESLFGSESFTKMSLRQLFLSIVQATESYHRLRIRNWGLSKEELQEYLAILDDTVPEAKERRCELERQSSERHSKHAEKILSALKNSLSNVERRSLVRWFKWSNEPSLEDRIYDLAKLTDGVVQYLISDVPAFCKRIRETRNKYAHGTKGNDDEYPNAFELWHLTQILFCVLQVRLLLELGLDLERSNDLVRRTRRFRNLSKWPLPDYVNT